MRSSRPTPAGAGFQAARGRPPHSNGRPDERLRWLLAAFALCALTLLVYANSFAGPIILDSKGLLLQDPRIRAATGENVALIFGHTYWWPLGEAGIYRPFTTLTYLFNYAILGNEDRAAGYHWVNLLLHMGNVLLVFALGRKLLGRLVPSALMAALWAVHPASTESVTNIIGRADLLAAMATLGGFLAYIRSTQAAGARRVAWLVALAIVTAAGVFSKESAVTIVGVIALYELAWPGRRRWLNLLPGLVAAGIPVAAMLFERAAVLAASPPAEIPFTDNPIAYAGFWAGRLTALKVAAHCLVQAVWPWRLSIDYSYAQIPLANGSVGDWLSVSLALLAAAGLAALWWGHRRAFFLAGFALIVFLPTSNLLFPIGAIRADRFLYLPAAGLLGCVVLAVEALGSRVKSPRLAPILILAVTAGFAARTWARNAEWHDEIALASADLKTSPRSFKLHRLLATALFMSDPAHANIDRVVEEADASLAILEPLPDLSISPETHRLAGAVWLAKGDRLRPASPNDAGAAYRRARELLGRCIRISQAHERQREARYGKSAPGVVARSEPDAYRLLSIVHLQLGDMDAALRAAREAKRMAPWDPGMYSQIAELLVMRGQGDEAAVALTAGMLITADQGLQSDLVSLYGSSADPANCTLVRGAGGPSIDPQCQIVRDHICAAAPEVLTALAAAGRRQEALEQKQRLLSEYQCAAGPLNEVLP
jgi:protein O-mannosyl-transferase